MLAAGLAVGLALGRTGPLLLDVQVIEASNRPQPTVAVSQAIRDLRQTLRYRSYRTVDHRTRPVGFGEVEQILLPDGAVARISALGVEQVRRKRSVRLRVRIQQGQESLDTEYSVRDGGMVLGRGGRHQPSDFALILAISPHLPPR